MLMRTDQDVATDVADQRINAARRAFFQRLAEPFVRQQSPQKAAHCPCPEPLEHWQSLGAVANFELGSSTIVDLAHCSISVRSEPMGYRAIMSCRFLPLCMRAGCLWVDTGNEWPPSAVLCFLSGERKEYANLPPLDLEQEGTCL